MREIKFRAWDGEQMMNRTLFDRNWYSSDDKCIRGAMPDDAINLKVMQCTGLSDNNGVDIYENDIVTDHVGKGVVEYNEKYAGFRVCYGDGYCKWFYDYNLRGERESIRVIGNIHENPEFLNKGDRL